MIASRKVERLSKSWEELVTLADSAGSRIEYIQCDIRQEEQV